jgi:hypothetical protein
MINYDLLVAKINSCTDCTCCQVDGMNKVNGIVEYGSFAIVIVVTWINRIGVRSCTTEVEDTFCEF